MPDTNTRWVLWTLAVLAGLILQQGAVLSLGWAGIRRRAVVRAR